MMGLAPRDFWATSFREWLAAMEGFRELHGGAGTEPMTRAQLEDLMNRYPDTPSKAPE